MSMIERLLEWIAGPAGPSDTGTVNGGAEVHQVRGFRVIVENSRADIATSDVLARLDDSLALIEEHQPWRLRHLERDLNQFLVARFPCRGAYFPEERICMTELTFLA